MKVETAYRHSLAGKLLIAMPNMGDPRFERTVIYMCLHSHDGAMGLVVNKPNDSLSFAELLSQLDIKPEGRAPAIRIHTGGPVETGKGFVLHSGEFEDDGTIKLSGGFALTTTVTILKSMAAGEGPRRSLLALGYSGWGPGQLDREIAENAWLTVDGDERLIFAPDPGAVWEQAFAKLRANPWMVSGTAGHA